MLLSGWPPASLVGDGDLTDKSITRGVSQTSSSEYSCSSSATVLCGEEMKRDETPEESHLLACVLLPLTLPVESHRDVPLCVLMFTHHTCVSSPCILLLPHPRIVLPLVFREQGREVHREKEGGSEGERKRERGREGEREREGVRERKVDVREKY